MTTYTPIMFSAVFLNIVRYIKIYSCIYNRLKDCEHVFQSRVINRVGKGMGYYDGLS